MSTINFILGNRLSEFGSLILELVGLCNVAQLEDIFCDHIRFLTRIWLVFVSLISHLYLVFDFDRQTHKFCLLSNIHTCMCICYLKTNTYTINAISDPLSPLGLRSEASIDLGIIILGLKTPKILLWFTKWAVLEPNINYKHGQILLCRFPASESSNSTVYPTCNYGNSFITKTKLRESVIRLKFYN